MRLNNFINRKGREDFRKGRKGNTNGEVVSAFYRLWDDRWYAELLAVANFAKPLRTLRLNNFINRKGRKDFRKGRKGKTNG